MSRAPITRRAVGLLVGAVVVLGFSGVALHQLVQGELPPTFVGVLAVVVVAAAGMVFGRRRVTTAVDVVRSLRGGEDGGEQ